MRPFADTLCSSYNLLRAAGNIQTDIVIVLS